MDVGLVRCLNCVSCIELCELLSAALVLSKHPRVTIGTPCHWAEWKSKMCLLDVYLVVHCIVESSCQSKKICAWTYIT